MESEKIIEMMMEDSDVIYFFLIEQEIATDKEIELVSHLIGYTTDVLTDILYVRTGYRNMLDYDHYELDDYYFNCFANKEEG